jgi:hypothetical protein
LPTKAIITGAMLALAVTTAATEESMNSVNDMLPYCKLTYVAATSNVITAAAIRLALAAACMTSSTAAIRPATPEASRQIIINHRYKLDQIDRLFYALLPLWDICSNAWDMMVWIVIKTPSNNYVQT